MNRTLLGKIVALTGASSGIGAALTRQLAEAGATVVINARRQERLDSLATEYPDSVHTVAGDITQASVQQSLIECCEVKFGRLDVLINNAGVGAIGRFADANLARLRKVMELNFFATAELTHRSIPLLKKGDQAVIVNIASVLGHRAVPLKTEYCASKFAVHGFSDALRAELVDDGIGVLLVSPSTTASEFFDSVLEDASGKNPTLSQPMAPEFVAARTVRALKRGSHEIIIPLSGKFLVWLDRFCPPLANWLVARHGKGT